MRTGLIPFIVVSRSRVDVVRAILEYPTRNWSCSALEEMTKLPHSTVFRTIKGLVESGVLKPTKINKKNISYELVRGSPFLKGLKRAINSDEASAKSIAGSFVRKVKAKHVTSVVLYGSAASGRMKPDSDIDLLVIIKKHDKELEKGIFDIAASLSSKFNRTIAVLIMGTDEIRKAKKDDAFIKSAMKSWKVIYGKEPFGTG